MSEFVQVAIRVRPLLASEIAEGCESILNTLEAPGEIYFTDHSKHFGPYNHVFSARAKQSDVYNRCIQPLIEKAFEGYNITVVSYGQKGSGKSYTMGTSHHPWNAEDGIGVIPRVIKDIFGKYKSLDDFTVNFSLTEIHQDQIYDLLAKKPRDQCVLNIEEGILQDEQIAELTNVSVNSPKEIFDAIQHNKIFKIDKLLLDTKGHIIFTLNLEQNCKKSKIQFIDLVGKSHEKQALKTYKGVLALEKIISALNEKDVDSKSVPYKDSNISRLLKDAFGGNSFTLMIACLSPADYDKNDTLSTLSYARMACKIKNNPTINCFENTLVRTDQANASSSLYLESSLKDTAMDQLYKQIKELTLKNRNLIFQLSMAQQTVTTKNFEISCLKTENTFLQKQIDQGEKKLKDFETQLSNLSKKFSEKYDTQIDNLKKNKEVLAEQLRENQNRVLELHTQLDVLKDTNRDQANQINQFQGLNDFMSGKMEQAQKYIASLETQKRPQITFPSPSWSSNSCSASYIVEEPDDLFGRSMSRALAVPRRSGGTGCGCQKTRCGTGHCGCRKAGVSCGSSCRCVGCLN